MTLTWRMNENMLVAVQATDLQMYYEGHAQNWNFTKKMTLVVAYRNVNGQRVKL